MSIWDILSHHEKISQSDYDDLRKILQPCKQILQEFQKKDILDEVILEHNCEWDSESYNIVNLITEIIDEFTRKDMICIGGRYGHSHSRYQRTDRKTCWYCGGMLREATEDEKDGRMR